MKQSRSNYLTLILAVCAIIASAIFIRQHLSSMNSSDDWDQLRPKLSSIVQKAGQSVIAIQAQHSDVAGELIMQNNGSGFIIDAAGFLVTNEHVIHKATRISVTLADKRKYIAQLIGADRRSDIAVLKIEADNLQHLPIGDTSKLASGQVVIALGNPLSTGADGKAVSTFGHINRLGTTLDTNIDQANDRYYDNLIQTDATVLPGSSGGPLINIQGQVIGINTAMGTGLGSGKLFGFAITLDKTTIDLINKLKKGRQPTHAFLGVQLARQLDQTDQQRLGIKEISGALVVDVLLAGPGQQAGILPGDLIKKVNDQRIYNRNDLLSYINRCQPGQVVQIKLLRGHHGKSRTITVSATLATRRLTDRDGYRREAAMPASTLWGLTVKNLSEWRKNMLRLSPAQTGVLVYYVQPESPAQKQNIKPGDIIIALNNYRIDNLRDFEEKYTNPNIKIKVLQKQ